MPSQAVERAAPGPEARREAAASPAGSVGTGEPTAHRRWVWVLGPLVILAGLVAAGGALQDRLSQSGPSAGTTAAVPFPRVPFGQPSLPAGAAQCEMTFDDPRLPRSARGNEVTTCEFAESVRKAYLSSGAQGERATVTARSPVTGQDYEMSCSGSAPVTCTGGENAVVLLY